MKNLMNDLFTRLTTTPVFGAMMVILVTLSVSYAEDSFGQGKYRPAPLPKQKPVKQPKTVKTTARPRTNVTATKGKYKLGQSGVLKGPFNNAARGTNPIRANNGGRGGHTGPPKSTTKPSPKRLTPIFNPAANPPGKGKPPDKATPDLRPKGPTFKPGGI